MSKNEDLEVERAERLYDNLYKKGDVKRSKPKLKSIKSIIITTSIIAVLILVLIKGIIKENHSEKRKIIKTKKSEIKINKTIKSKIYNYKNKEIIYAYCEKEYCFIQTDKETIKTDLSIKKYLGYIEYGRMNTIRCKSYKDTWKECKILN